MILRPTADVTLEVGELRTAAEMLLSAHTSSLQERPEVVRSFRPSDAADSGNLCVFLGQIVEAETDLPEEPPTNDTVTPYNPRMSVISAQTALSELTLRSPLDGWASLPAYSRDELYLPGEPLGVALTIPDEDLEALATPSAVPHGLNIGRGENSLISSMSGNAAWPPAPPPKTPPVPPKSPGRPRSSGKDRIRPASTMAVSKRPAIRRKPVATVSGRIPTIPEPSGSSEHVPMRRRANSTSPVDSALSLMEKVTPLTQSLSSLPTNEYLNIELDQPPVEPYPDNPPVYSQVSDAVATLSTIDLHGPVRRRTQSSLASDNSPFVMRLARENRLDDLTAALKEGYNVDEIDTRSGRTAIMEAAQLRRWEVCRLLLKANARLHLKDTNGDTALHHAAREGDAETCQMLLDLAALSEDCNKDGQTPVELAAMGGHTQAVQVFINANPARRTNEPTMVKAFLEAIKLGDITTAQAFMAMTVRPKKIKDSWKPVCYAAQGGSLPMLELILAQKCSLKERSPAGWTPLHFAAAHGQLPMVERLMSQKLSPKTETKKSEETPLHLAARAGHSATALTILARKDSNAVAKDVDNQEPIHHAIRNGDLKLMAALIDEGAKLGNANKYGWKAIHLASAYGHVALLAECMTRGISIEEKLLTPSFKPEKRTNEAARRGYWAEIRWPHSGARPLHLALEFGHDDVALMLISGGAKIDEADSRGWRPLHYAAFHCRPDMLQLLLQKRATVDAKTDDGHTPLTLGFREYGNSADSSQRWKIRDMLQLAMLGQKKSKLRSLSFKSSGSEPSKIAARRNLAWHTAQLAESLYQKDNSAMDEGEDDEISMSDSDVAASTTGGRGELDGGAQDLYEAQPQPGPSSSKHVGRAT
jgi:ankyrin repeat protein